MNYRVLGNTGVKVSLLGFGAMRLPNDETNGVKKTREADSIKAIHRAFDLGVNYIDTALVYGDSELVVAKALKGYRQNVYVATKAPTWDFESQKDYRKFLEQQLKRLDVDYIDFYFFHGLDETRWNERILRHNILDEVQKAKDAGLIRHASFSFHDKPDVMKRFVDTGMFASVLCQYNIIDRSNEDAIAYANSKGVGVIAMGPLAGGWLAGSYEDKSAADSMIENSLKFIFSNTNVQCAISGMSTVEMVEQNARIAAEFDPSNPADQDKIQAILGKLRRLNELYCTGCNYCMPCPAGIRIPSVFKLLNYYRLGATELAKAQFKNFGTDSHYGASPADCTECGQCEEKCPQKVKVREQLKTVVSELSS